MGKRVKMLAKVDAIVSVLQWQERQSLRMVTLFYVSACMRPVSVVISNSVGNGGMHTIK
jgi:hypothetical protein